MNDDLNAPWLFVIDTEDYSGNFERELCAYITGRVGECGVGDDMAEIFKKEVGDALEGVIEETDEHGCSRPTSIYPTPGWFNNGHGSHHKDGDEENALKEYRKIAAAYHRNQCCFGYLKEWRENPSSHEHYERAKWTEEKLIKACEIEEECAKEAENATKIPKWPAYLSVAISFERKPTPEQIALMKERSFKFAALPNKWNIKGTRIGKITGFRLIENIIERKPKTTEV
jgi:hypothetical protein